MPEYKLPLAKRMRISARRKERYATEPAYRLARLNENRRRKGLPPLTSLEGISMARDWTGFRRNRSNGRFY